MVMPAKKPGFTLIELVIFVALAGIIYGAISQMIPKRRPADGAQELFVGLNNLISLSGQEAVSKQLPARLEFKTSRKRGLVNVRAKVMDRAGKGKKAFKNIESGFVSSKFEFPANVELVRWWTDSGKSSDGGDELKINVSPDGFAQIAIMHFIEESDGEKKKFSGIINPFMGELKKSPGFMRMPKSESEKSK